MASFSSTAPFPPSSRPRSVGSRPWAFMAVGRARDRRLLRLPPDCAIGLLRRDRLRRGVSRSTSARSGTCPKGQRLAWQLFSLGLLGQVAGDAIFAVYEVSLNREPPHTPRSPMPSTSAAIRCSSWACCSCCVGSAGRRAVRRSSTPLVIFSGVALVQWVFFIDPYNHMAFGSEFARLVSMAYPAMDMLLLVAFAQLIVGPGGRTRAYRLLLASIALWVVADEVYGLNATTRAAAGSTRCGSARMSSGRPRRSTRRWHGSPCPTADGSRDSRARDSCCSRPPR